MSPFTTALLVTTGVTAVSIIILSSYSNGERKTREVYGATSYVSGTVPPGHVMAEGYTEPEYTPRVVRLDRGAA